MCRKLWPVYSCGHEQIPAQSTRFESCGDGKQCPEFSWGWGYYTLETDCGSLRCSTAIRTMLNDGRVKMADWKWNYAARAGSSYGGGGGSSSSTVGSGSGFGQPHGDNNVGYAGNAGNAAPGYPGGHCAGYGSGGYTPMPTLMPMPMSGPSTAGPGHGAPLLPHIPLPYPNSGGGYGPGYGPAVLRPMSAPPAPCFGPFIPPFLGFDGGNQECPPPPPTQIILRFRR